MGDYIVSGPYAHENLAIYLVHGEDRISGAKFLTLQEALEQKKAIVHETGDVNELAIQNVSDEYEVFVQAGDIVKGGKQDRVIASDFIVPVKSDKMPISSFCVEQGRWANRGGENVAQFSVSDAMLNTKALKMAAKKSASQSEVWANVSVAQSKLASNVGLAPRATDSIDDATAGQVVVAVDMQEMPTEVPEMNAPQQMIVAYLADQSSNGLSLSSPTSLQLTLEHQDVTKAADAYIDALESIVKDKDDVIGFAFAINGEVNSADVYACKSLFAKLWPKLLKASALEAVAEAKEGQTVDHPTRDTLVAELFKKIESDTATAEETVKPITERVRMKTRENDSVIMFTTTDATAAEEALHFNYIKK
jgi:hypothetical protein